jgi:dihydroflavonol-4-reductase
MEKQKPSFDLAVINPYLVMGPSLDLFGPINQTVFSVELILTGGQPITLPLSEGIVDVRDIAMMHVLAMETPEAKGHRFIGCSDSMTNQEMCKVIREYAPEKLKRNCPTHAPLPLPVFILAMYAYTVSGKGTADYIRHNAYHYPKFDTSPLKDILHFECRPSRETIKDTVNWLVERRQRMKNEKKKA